MDAELIAGRMDKMRAQIEKTVSDHQGKMLQLSVLEIAINQVADGIADGEKIDRSAIASKLRGVASAIANIRRP